MTDSPESPERFSLSRWSRRKHEATREKSPPAAAPDAIAPPVAVAATSAATAVPPVEPLPPVESLTIDSDFRAFLAPEVEEDTKRAALKKLFSDPHFNVMDGLDIYIDDYSKPDPMPEGMLAKLRDVYETLTEDAAKDTEAKVDSSAATTAPAAAPAEVIVKDEAGLPPDDSAPDKPA